jgi:hypothetical protein
MMVHKSTKDPYVRFWIEDGVEVAMCTAADFRDAMNERDRLWRTLRALEHPGGRPCPWCLTPTGFDHGPHCEIAAVLGSDRDG